MFGRDKFVIGMLHAPALPGSPGSKLSITELTDWVLRDTEALASGGVDALMLENFGDVPFYPKRVPSHTVACLTVLAHEVRRATQLPLGINMLRNDGLSALAVASAVGAAFIRVNVYTGARLTDQGIVEGEAHLIQRYRKELQANVLIFADIAVKHSAALGVRGLEDEVEDTIRRGLADAVIVSGSGTGKETSLEELSVVKSASGAIPVLVGSGATVINAVQLLKHADGLIAGTSLKADGVSTNPVDRQRVRELMAAIR